jgi:hypothetical protein
MQQSLDPMVIYAALRDHHLPRMRAETKRTLVLRSRMKSLADIANVEAVSEATIRARLNTGLAEIFETVGEPVERDGWTASTWVGLHLACCLASAVAELEAA